jgi:hypothetical protein
MATQKRYGRPWLQIEFNQEALVNQQGCCRLVEVVVRLGNIPPEPALSLTTWRESRQTAPTNLPRAAQQEGAHDDYNPHPAYRPVPKGAAGPFLHYYEAAFLLLARAHSEETGVLQVEMTSSAGGQLSHVVFHLDTRQPQPVMREQAKGFTSLDLIPRILGAEERDALCGGRLLLNAPDAAVTGSGAVQESLFPL